MSIGKVVRNAGSHRILYALSHSMKTSRELKLIVGAINSISRFDGEYMSRLVSSGYVRKTNGGWAITRQGKEKLEELGPASGLRLDKQINNKMDRPVYVPSRDNQQRPLRPGSEDFLNHPSRVGQWLIYRDGRKERIE